MDLLQAIVLGVVQGLTEFAPISSSAHLVIVPWLLGWPEPSLLFDTILHVGTLAAVIGAFWRDIWTIVRDWLWSLMPGRRTTYSSHLGWVLIVGTVPAAVLGYVFKDFFEALFARPLYVGIFLLCTAGMLVLAERIGRMERKVEQVSIFDSFLIGVGQAIAIAPGISRSGATMSVGLLIGLTRADSARFSFLLSVPIILGAAASQIKELFADISAVPISSSIHIPPLQGAAYLTAGFLAAAISGYLCINFMLGFLRRRSFGAFAAYCALLGVTTIAISLIRTT